MLSVKEPAETVELTVYADAKTPAEELADRFRAFPTPQLGWRVRVARHDAEASSRLAATGAQSA